ncbi:23.6 kDa heat shock protein, mitochondrial [Artemisia annua]|uniref:23.6 kDa heat shock protein, mitochondrial n=1 Tax=Artemisia annua TaxID=35608 RepID=A0A2U1Q3A5_ARTAN|nr:23.6 kDa heat shock protein, mitochondrial [Artemisia annua]
MASSLARLVVSNRSLGLFRPVITSSSRFLNTKCLNDDNDDSEDNMPTFSRTCPPFIHDLMSNCYCPRLSAARNLSRQLNLMDDLIGVKSTHHEIPRWSVGEEDDNLFILRDMVGLHDKDVNESVQTRDMASLLHLTHFDTPCPSWDVMKEAKELDQFVESTSGMHVISSVRVFCTTRYIRAIYIIVGHEGPDPGDPYGGYVSKIYLPRRFYKIDDVHIQINHETLNITIPKNNYGNPIYKIKGDFLLFCERKNDTSNSTYKLK